MGIRGGSSGGGGHTIEDEGTPLIDRSAISFEGAGVEASDSGSKTIVTITGSGVGEANTTSNKGSGEGLALPKEIVDLPMKSITTTDGTITTAPNATELDFRVTNPFSVAEKTKLTGIESGATADQTNAEIKTAYEANLDTNEFSDAEQTKLAGIETGATADQTNAEIETAYNAQVAIVTQPEAEAGTSTVVKRWTPQRVKQAIDALGGGGGGATDTEYPIPLVQEVPQGTVGHPDIHSLATATAKVSGMVLPDGSVSTINFKTMHPIPDDLAGTPATRIEFVIMTKGAVAGPADVRLTVSTLAVSDTENFDQAFTAETETTVTMPTATETQDVYSQNLTNNPVAGDTVLVKLQRDPTDVADDFTDDIQIISATLWIHRST